MSVDQRKRRGSAGRDDLEGRWRKRFEQRGSRFRDDAHIAGWSSTGLASRLRRFLALWPGVTQGERWIDAGCGGGTYTRLLAQQGAHVLGVDYSLPSILRARGRSCSTVMWCAADLRQIPVASGHSDGIVCLGVMQSLSSPDDVLQELVRTLRSGGALWVDALNRYCVAHLASEGWRVLRGRHRHLRYDGPRDLQRRLREVGADRVRLFWLPLAPGRFGYLQRAFEHPLACWIFRHVPGVGLLLSHSFILWAEASKGERSW